MSYDRLAPTISSKAKKLFGSGNMGWVKIIGGGARPPVPLSDGLDTRRCKILDPRLQQQYFALPTFLKTATSAVDRRDRRTDGQTDALRILCGQRQ